MHQTIFPFLAILVASALYPVNAPGAKESSTGTMRYRCGSPAGVASWRESHRSKRSGLLKMTGSVSLDDPVPLAPTILSTAEKAAVVTGFPTDMDQMQWNHRVCWEFPGLEALVDYAGIHALTAAGALRFQNGIDESPSRAGKSKVVDESHFRYPYEKVLDYYVIEAWRRLDEPVPAYTPEMVARHTRVVGELPWVTPTASGNEQMVLGQTPGWPRTPDQTNDPKIPPRNIYGYQITDRGDEGAEEGEKVKMVLASGNHATEFTGNWVLEGMVNFLVGGDPRAIFLRRKAVFYVYPDVNPEGRYQAVHRIDLEAAPDPNAGTNMRKRGNPELYAAGERDHNRVWTTQGKFSTVDTITAAMEKDTGGRADYLWDMHGPQTRANWRSPTLEARSNEYAKFLMKREPDVIRCGPPGGFKRNVASGPPGKLSLWAASDDGLKVTYPYVYEPGGWTRERLLKSGRNLALALYDVLAAQ